MVYVLDGCSFHHAHIQNKQIFKNLPKHMLTLKKTLNQSFLEKKNFLSHHAIAHIHAQHVLDDHLI